MPVFIVTLVGMVALLAFAAHRIDQLSPAGRINGLYQSDQIGQGHYNAQFFGDQFYIEMALSGQTQTLLEGTFDQVVQNGNAYLLEDSGEGDEVLVVLGHSGFYFYDAQRGQMVYFDKKAPIR